MQDDLNAQLLQARFESGETNLAVTLHGMGVARIDECAGLPYRDVECRALGQLVEIKIACMRARWHRGRDARAQRGEIAIGRRYPQNALEGPQWNGDVGHEFTLHGAQVEIDILDLPLRIVLRQQAGANRTRVVEDGAPFVGTDPLIANLQRVARLGHVHGDWSND